MGQAIGMQPQPSRGEAWSQDGAPSFFADFLGVRDAVFGVEELLKVGWEGGG
jgi:hypothetical protein